LPANRHAAGEPLHPGIADEEQLKELITRHAEYTGSVIASAILANWDGYREKFVKVYPHEYKRALTEMAAAAREGGRIMGKPTGFIEFERASTRPTSRWTSGSSITRSSFTLNDRRRQDTGRTLHGLRHSVLQQRLPGQQHHSRLE
jgi:hypothetical protein